MKPLAITAIMQYSQTSTYKTNMIKFLQNKFTILVELLVLLLSAIWFLNSFEIEPLIGILLSTSGLVAPLLKTKESPKIKVLGQISKKILDKDFLKNYIPGELSIQKVIEEFGLPNCKLEDFVEQKWNNNVRVFFYVYKYKFSNAVVLFTTSIGDDNLISISVVSTDSNNPIICRYSYFETEDEILGEAEFKKSIIENLENFENNQYAKWSYSAITSRYADYHPIKDLHFTYFNYNFHEEADDLYLETINGVCTSISSEIHPIIQFDDYICT